MNTSSAIINTCDFGSTGKIAAGLQAYLLEKGEKCVFCYGHGADRDDDKRYKFTRFIDLVFHKANTMLTGSLCRSSVLATERLVKRLRSLNVSEVYLINLHGLYLNERILFDYLVENKVKVVYIMADESAFLGNCFYRNGCEKFKDRCIGCNRLTSWQKIISPQASHRAYEIKRNAYRKLNAIYVAPEFVINSAKESPLMDGCRTEIIDEAIDVIVNAPRDTKVLRNELGIAEDKIIIGCVAPFSDPRKGVRHYLEAARELERDQRFVFVQVGYDVRSKDELPGNYIPIPYVSNQMKLVEYYSLMDLFVFPSLADTMPNACLEALACGTPLLCFNISGMPYIGDSSVMTLVEPGNINRMTEVIKRTEHKSQAAIDICRNYALSRYDSRLYCEKLVSAMKSL